MQGRGRCKDSRQRCVGCELLQYCDLYRIGYWAMILYFFYFFLEAIEVDTGFIAKDRLAMIESRAS